jgi:ABC-2 type transport system permease protein
VAGAGVLSAVSPFTLANRSRALVPGYGLDLQATLGLVTMATVLLLLAAAADERRDYAAPLWTWPASSAARRPRVPHVMLGSVATATLRRGFAGLLVWGVATATFAALLAALQPTVIDLWSEMGYLSAFGGEAGVEASYWTFATSVMPALLAAYVVSQASGWVRDLQQGRVEMLRSTPVSGRGLVAGRLIALLVAVAVITLLAMGAVAAVAGAVGSPLEVAGVGRVTVTAVLFGAAMGGLAAAVVALVRGAAAVTALALVVAASYLLTYLVPLFGWPEWLNRLSLFWSFGQPYLDWPPAGRIVALVGVAVGGSVVAAVVTDRTPAVP